MEEAVRLREANRKQLILHPTDLDGLLEAEHPARAIWRVLERVELGRVEEAIKERQGSAGRDGDRPENLLGCATTPARPRSTVAARWRAACRKHARRSPRWRRKCRASCRRPARGSSRRAGAPRVSASSAWRRR